MNKNITIIILSLTVIITLSAGCTEENNKEKQNNNENNIKNGIVPLEDLTQNISNYIGHKITAQGYIRNVKTNTENQSYFTYLCNSNKENPTYCIILFVPTNITLLPGAYQVTGNASIHENIIPRIDIISVKSISN